VLALAFVIHDSRRRWLAQGCAAKGNNWGGSCLLFTAPKVIKPIAIRVNILLMLFIGTKLLIYFNVECSIFEFKQSKVQFRILKVIIRRYHKYNYAGYRYIQHIGNATYNFFMLFNLHLQPSGKSSKGSMQ